MQLTACFPLQELLQFKPLKLYKNIYTNKKKLKENTKSIILHVSRPAYQHRDNIASTKCKDSDPVAYTAQMQSTRV